MGLAPYGEPRYAQLILDHLIDLKADGSFRLDQSYFDYCTGLRMTNERFDALFGGPPRGPDERLTQRHMDLAASIQAVTDEAVLRLTRAIASETGEVTSLPGGRRRAELRRQRQGAARRRFSDLGAAGGRGRRRRARRGPCGVPPVSRSAAPSSAGRRDGGLVSRAAFAQGRVEEALRRVGGRFSVGSDEPHRSDRCRPRRGQGRRLVPGADGIRPARPRCPLHPGRSAVAAHAVGAEPQGQVPGVVPTVRAVRPPRGLAQWFELDEDCPYMLLVADVVKHLRREMTEDEHALFGIDKLNVPRSAIPGCDPRGLLGPHPDRPPRDQPAVSRPALAVEGVDRLPGDRQHELQRAGRAHRRARRRMPSAASWARRSRFLPRGTAPAQGGPGSGAEARLQDRPSRRTRRSAEIPREPSFARHHGFNAPGEHGDGVTSTMTESDSSSAASSGYCGYFS